MFGDNDSVFDRLWDLITDRLAVIFPLRIIERSESLVIEDYRPTLTMFLTAAGFLVLALSFVFLFFRIDEVAFGLWALAIPGAVSVIFLFRGTVREAYYFNKTKDSYAFVRQFIHRREVIEGSLSQFTGAYVKTETQEESESYYVVLKQDGMFLTGVGEQTLREELPIFDSFDREARIANAISSYLYSKR